MLVGKIFFITNTLAGRISLICLIKLISVEAVFSFSHTNLTRHFVKKFSKNELVLEFSPCKNIPNIKIMGKTDGENTKNFLTFLCRQKPTIIYEKLIKYEIILSSQGPF
jgi:hypothetical protein